MIARGSLKKFGLVEQKGSVQVPRFTKKSAPNKFFGIAKLDTVAMGNSVIHAVLVGIFEIPNVDGFFGFDQMRRIGAVLDCAEAALYLAPRRPSSRTGSKLATMLQSNGFTQVPMLLNSDHHLEVACSIDGVPSTIVVDTGSPYTLVDESIGIKAGITMKQFRTPLRGSAGDSTPLRTGHVKELAIGDFMIRDTDIHFIDFKKADRSSTYLLGIGELASNSAIIDVAGLSMYLRHQQ
jgi:hypothetical protein